MLSFSFAIFIYLRMYFLFYSDELGIGDRRHIHRPDCLALFDRIIKSIWMTVSWISILPLGAIIFILSVCNVTMYTYFSTNLLGSYFCFVMFHFRTFTADYQGVYSYLASMFDIIRFAPTMMGKSSNLMCEFHVVFNAQFAEKFVIRMCNY